MMNRPSAPTPNQPPSGLPGAASAAQAASDAAPAAGSVISALPGPGPVGLADGPPAELAATIPHLRRDADTGRLDAMRRGAS